MNKITVEVAINGRWSLSCEDTLIIVSLIGFDEHGCPKNEEICRGRCLYSFVS